MVDELRLGNWLASEDGHKNRNRPTPISPLAPRNQLGRVPDNVSQDQVIELLASLAPSREGA